MNVENTLKLQQNLLDYAESKEGAASMMEHFVGLVYKDPDIDPEKLFSLANEYVELIGLDGEETALTHFIIGRYISKRQRMKEVRRKYPCDNQFFKAVCGMEPQGKVAVDLRPITFNFVCDDLRDYALLTNTGMQNNGFPVNRSLLRGVQDTGGMFLKYELFKDPELKGSIIIENVEDEYEEERVLFRMHEEQHALNSFFQESYVDFFEKGYQETEETIPLFLYRLANVTEIDDVPLLLAECNGALLRQSNLLTRLLRKDRMIGENQSKEEILAYLRMGVIDVDDKNSILRIFKKSKRYDFYSNENRKRMEKDCVELFRKYTGVKRENMIKRVIEKVFVTEYEQLLIDSTEAISFLRDAGFAFNRTMFLLMTEPLRNWKKMAERMYVAQHIKSLEQEKNQPLTEV